MIAYTKIRKVPLCNAGGTPKSPPIILNPMTRVAIDVPETTRVNANIATSLGSVWVKVTVLDVPHRDVQGWIAAPALTDNSLSQSFVGGTTRLTGRSYGDDVFLWDGQENRIWCPNCPYCGLDPESHRIIETAMDRSDVLGKWNAPKSTTAPPAKNENGYFTKSAIGAIEPRSGEKMTALKGRTRINSLIEDEKSRVKMVEAPRGVGTSEDALMLYDRLLSGGKKKVKGLGYGPSAAVMIGVLHVGESDNVYASHSGRDVNAPFREICQDLGFIYAGPVEFPVMNRSGERAHAELQNPELFQCAAPRLIQAAIKDGEWPCAMTEVWFEPDNKHAKYVNEHTIESCDLCRRTVPMMLCPDSYSTTPSSYTGPETFEGEGRGQASFARPKSPGKGPRRLIKRD